MELGGGDSYPSTRNSSMQGGQQIENGKRSRNASFCSNIQQSYNLINPEDDREKSAKKFFLNWRQACDKTKDRTKELLKRTISWKDTNQLIELEENDLSSSKPQNQNNPHGWSVHVWTTWVRRSEEMEEITEDGPINLSLIQKEKFTHFFCHLLDTDRDDLISIHDFCILSEKLRHFANWPETGTDFCMLQQVQQGFIRTFFPPQDISERQHRIEDEYISLNQWLKKWSEILTSARIINDLPFWLQYLPKIFFCIINKSGSCVITKDELKTFYISVIGQNPYAEQDLLNAYNSMTANSKLKLQYTIYELCFSNWLFCTNPNGPGQWIFGKCGIHPECFPIDYSTLNTSAEDIEVYNSLSAQKSNRVSVIV